MNLARKEFGGDGGVQVLNEQNIAAQVSFRIGYLIKKSRVSECCW